MSTNIIKDCTLVDVWKLLVDIHFCKSRSEASRAIENNSIKIFENDDWIIPDFFALQEGQKVRYLVCKDLNGKVIKFGKHKFARLNFNTKEN